MDQTTENLKEHPLRSEEGAAWTFICDKKERFQLWAQALEVRYWLDYGERQEYDVEWHNELGSNGSQKSNLLEFINSQSRMISCFSQSAYTGISARS